MPGLERVPGNVRTVYLGQFLVEHANAIGTELDAHDIVWWSKVPNGLTRFWDPGGVHLFVDRAKLDEAKRIAAAVVGA